MQVGAACFLYSSTSGKGRQVLALGATRASNVTDQHYHELFVFSKRV